MKALSTKKISKTVKTSQPIKMPFYQTPKTISRDDRNKLVEIFATLNYSALTTHHAKREFITKVGKKFHMTDSAVFNTMRLYLAEVLKKPRTQQLKLGNAIKIAKIRVALHNATRCYKAYTRVQYIQIEVA